MTLRLAALALIAVLLQAPAAMASDGGLPTAVARSYEAISSNTDFTLGSMKLSTTSARFTVLKGTMQLEYTGEMPVSSSIETSGSKVYRVTNADAYFKANKGANGFCSKPVRWVGIRSLEQDMVRVIFLTGADYRAYSPDSHDLCSGDTYALEAP